MKKKCGRSENQNAFKVCFINAPSNVPEVLCVGIQRLPLVVMFSAAYTEVLGGEVDEDIHLVVCPHRKRGLSPKYTLCNQYQGTTSVLRK